MLHDWGSVNCMKNDSIYLEKENFPKQKKEKEYRGVEVVLNYNFVNIEATEVYYSLFWRGECVEKFCLKLELRFKI